MNAIALYEHDPSTCITERHLKLSFPNKYILSNISYVAVAYCGGGVCGVFISKTNGATLVFMSNSTLKSPSKIPSQSLG